MSRTPTPRRILELRGSRIRGPHKNEVPSQLGTPNAPEYLCDLALAEWNRVVPLLIATRILSLTHEKTLAAYCDCVADVEIASKELTRDGQTILDSTGRKINHPAWARKRDARAQMLRYASEFGLTPSPQSKVSLVSGPILEEGIDPRIFG